MLDNGETKKTPITPEKIFTNRYSDGLNSDRQNPEERAWMFKNIFNRDIFKPKGFLDQEIVKGKVLDLGSGKGGLGIFLKEINPEIVIVGTDTVDYSKKGLISDRYSEIFQQEAVAFLEDVQKSGKKFDLIVSCGLPYETIIRLIEKIDFGQVLDQNGTALFLVDYQLDEETIAIAESKGFSIRQGNYPIDLCIITCFASANLKPA